MNDQKVSRPISDHDSLQCRKLTLCALTMAICTIPGLCCRATDQGAGPKSKPSTLEGKSATARNEQAPHASGLFAPILDSSFVDSEHGWILVGTGELLRTVDGGVSWVSSPEKIPAQMTNLCFIDPDHGWGLTGAEVWKTVDGGVTWARLATLVDSKGRPIPDGFHVEFAGATEGWITAPFSISISKDGGENWTRYPFSTALRSALFADPESGWAWGQDPDGFRIYQTVDGGQVWRPVSTRFDDQINTVFFIDRSDGWLSLFGGTIYGTIDGGMSWTKLKSLGRETQIDSMQFIDASTGWMAGIKFKRDAESTEPEPTGILLHTVDGGQSWAPATVGAEQSHLDAVKFVDAYDGWLVGTDTVYRTTDGGGSWNQVLTVPSQPTESGILRGLPQQKPAGQDRPARAVTR